MKNKLGYKKYSPFKNEPFIDIKGNSITMDDVEFPILALPNNNKPVIMKPNRNYIFPNSSKVREIPLKNYGGFIGMAGESTVPVSPFINLKPFINKYKGKKQYGGLVEYVNQLPSYVQGEFINDFESLDREEKGEVIKMLRGGYYQQGGIAEINRSQFNGNFQELEHKETVLEPDGKLKKVTGKTHKQGGEIVSLPDGTRIYSEFIKVPQEVTQNVLDSQTKKKYSYAELSKKFPTEKYMDIIKEDKDDYAVETAKLKLLNNLSKLDTLFFAQEKEKEINSKQKDNFQEGGWVTPNSPYYIKQPTTDKPEIDWSFISSLNPSPPINAQQGEYEWDYPKIHTEPFPTVSTGVRLLLDNPTIKLPQEEQETQEISPYTVPTDLQLVMPQRNKISKAVITKGRTKPKSTTSIKNTDSNFIQIPLELEQLPTKGLPQTITSNSVKTNPLISTTNSIAENIIQSSDSRSYPENKKRKFNFGVSNELAGTIADIGLALSDRLNVKEPTLYNRQKTPLFSRFVDFDDQDVARTFSLRSQQIQNSDIPEQVKQAQLSALNAEYQDYQAKVDFANLQRYESKRERDTEKLQQYIDRNVDIKVEDLENYNQRKARVDELRYAFKAQRKARIVNALKQYAQYADEVNYKNQLIDNYSVNPITGRIEFKEKPTSQLTSNLLSRYQQSQSKIDLGNGSVGQVFGNLFVVTDKEGKTSVNKLE